MNEYKMYMKGMYQARLDELQHGAEFVQAVKNAFFATRAQDHNVNAYMLGYIIEATEDDEE